jgi:pSer/pThr/pTyr-binding forkhead associated (FHA) protein
MNDVMKTQALGADINRTQLGAPPTLDANRTIMGTAPTLNATVTIKPVQCPICKMFNPAGMMFCIECGLIFDKALPEDAFGAPAVKLPCLVDSGGREYPLRPGTNMVGREGDVMITDGRVSRRHAQVTLTDGNMTVEELGSTNGSLLNGERLESGAPKPLKSGDKVSFGGFDMVLSIPGATQSTQMIPSSKTAAISAAPKLEPPAAFLVGDDLKLPLKQGVNVFGRKSANDVQIADPYVSGKHGTIEVTDDGVFLTDTGSTNGTVVNDAKLAVNQRTKIGPDDRIQLGDLTLKVELS